MPEVLHQLLLRLTDPVNESETSNKRSFREIILENIEKRRDAFKEKNPEGFFVLCAAYLLGFLFK